jgi:hypothetical protein
MSVANEANKRVLQLPNQTILSPQYNQQELLRILEAQRIMIKALQTDVARLSGFHP